ncbi:dual specificity protein kinase Ttk isoform X1 [Electrophorus electricus]|uniref:dual specificity protein kinase Ttk isoform X1 n=2 Tax=Electrophorus electricus TaxID=8005 RepID=UPI0015D041BE|nr:dual specificity protein kinase Ttk isoform X1 [Electrophorus electricus]
MIIHVLGMDDDENTDRQLQIAKLYQKLEKMKRYYNDDDTDNINQLISSNSPESCRTFLSNLEKKGNPHTDPTFLSKLIDFYTRVFSSMPLGKFSQNVSYARMLVKFAELKSIQDVNEAQDSFEIARSHCKDFAFVHIAYAQFELLQGNEKKSAWILQEAFEMGAKPSEVLEAAMQNLKLGRRQLFSQENKENLAATALENAKEPMKSRLMSKGISRASDESDDFHLASGFSLGTEYKNSPQDDLPVWQYGSERKRAMAMPGRIPMVPLSIPENENVDIVSKPEASSYSSSLSRSTYRSNASFVLPLSSAKKNSGDGDSYNLLCLKPLISPEPRPWEDTSDVDSTTALLNRPERKITTRLDDTTDNINQIISSSSPEACLAYLTNLEKQEDPRADSAFLCRLLECYSKVFSRLPLAQNSKTESYARMLVRYAELKGIEDPDDAEDNFLIARTNSKAFAFVHIAHAQFELSRGNTKKSASILQKALALNAKPAELLQMAVKNLKSGKTQLLPTEDKEDVADVVATHSDRVGKEEEYPLRISRNDHQRKSCAAESLSEWRIPARINKHASPEEHKSPIDHIPTPRPLNSVRTSSVAVPPRLNPATGFQTPNCKNPQTNSFVTPVVKQTPAVVSVPSTAQRVCHASLPCTPQSQGPVSAFSNESITIKGRQFFILKMIGRGGSSKVYQVLDQKKQLYAVKYVNLEEADTQTVESYKNEIEHLNHLQQYSDQIIKLYDYEITDSYIYMLMECGNLDLNTWLRNRKSVSSLERKFYWRNMLEAVQTIHKHGIVHSDLKPANFVIVNASLKLIDFGIANHIQPDMTSVMKDSQVGTLNYMPPEAIKDTSSNGGKPRSKISPKGDVWSLGCILYCMTYGKTPFQNITNQITKLHAIIDPSHEIDFPDISEKDLLDVLKRCLVRNPKERISIAELMDHPYLQLQPQPPPEPEPCNSDLKRILNELAALQSPNSIARAASNLAKMCNSGRKLDVSECVKRSSQSSWK